MTQDQIDLWIAELSNRTGPIWVKDSIYQALNARRNLQKVQTFLANNVDNRLYG